MKRLIPLLLLASCTMHQDERFQELLLSPKQSMALRNEHIVQDALFYSPSSAQFSIEKLDTLTLPHAANFYALQGFSLPVEERCLLASYDPLRGKIAVQLEFRLLADHTLEIYTPEGSEIVREAPLVLKNLLQGQEVDLALISKERRTCTKVRFTPHPIQLEEHGAVYTLQTIHRKGTHFLLHGAGLLPNESITIREHSEDILREHTVQAGSDGKFTQPIEPIVLGRLGGIAHIDIERPNAPASHIDYPWGGKLENASQKETPFCPLVFAIDRDPQEIDALALLPKFQKKLTI